MPNDKRSDTMATAVCGGVIRAASGRLLICFESWAYSGQSPLPLCVSLPAISDDGVSALVNLLPFGICFALAEIFVVVGQSIHEQPEKADEAGAHRVKPLRGMHEKHGGAEETSGTDHPDDGVEPSDHGLEIHRKRCR
jgi:hypothetical protein